MKYVAVIVLACAAYLSLAPKAPVGQGIPSLHALTTVPEPDTDFLKAPLDHTHDVLKQAHARADDPALKLLPPVLH